ncbi:MAG: sphingomyelin phosphodiesterase [Phycisphaerae bacterium]|nr:sphingomyelin phosphodiesterase [Phycisphaerae bacterium]
MDHLAAKTGPITTTRRIAAIMSCAWMGVATLLLAPSATTLAESKSAPTLKVTTYNVQFLPGLASLVNQRKDAPYRARTIGRKLKDFDIIGLNETFDDRPRELLLDQLRQAWGKDFNVVISPKPEGRLSGGCAIVSRLPFVEKNSTIYTAFSTPEKYGVLADGFAAKGAIHARIQLAGTGVKPDFVDVFATHLDSKDAEARKIQYKELADFIKAHGDPDRPVLILGDLNTHGAPSDISNPDSLYSFMMSVFRKARPDAELIDLWPHLKKGVGGTSRQLPKYKDGGSRIDYIILSNPKPRKNRLVPVDVRVNRHLDPKVEALSDHSAVEAEFR